MIFYLTTLHLAKFLQEDPPEPRTDRASILAADAWTQGEFLCWNYILNGQDDSLYNVYNPIPTAKNLWGRLDKKYKTNYAGTKKFVVGQFHEYKMVDSRTWSVKRKSFNLSCTRLRVKVLLYLKLFKLLISWRNSHLHKEISRTTSSISTMS